VRIIARKTLRQFVEKLKGSKDQKAVRSALDAWFHEVLRADWKAPADVVKAYANASIVGPDRLVVAINYRHQVVFIKWLGTHEDYDEN
jgi:mRNA interferase HigB